MTDHENPIRGIAVGLEPTIVPVGLWQSEMDGLNALIHWLQGFEAAGHGRIPGHHDLVMHYRALRDAVHSIPIPVK